MEPAERLDAEFTLEFQDKTVAVLLSDAELNCAFEPECFDNPLVADFVKIINEFGQKYKRPPSLEEFISELEDFLSGNRGCKGMDEFYAEKAEQIVEIITDARFDYVKDKVTDFLRYKAHQKAIIDSAELLVKGDYDGIRKSFEKAAIVGIGRSGLETVVLSDVEPKEVEWLWPDRIPLGKLTLIVGDPGVGKGFLSMMIAAHVSTGRPWPTNLLYEFEPSKVLLLDAEDSAADTIVPRLNWNHADLSKIVQIRGAKEGRMFSLTEDLAALEREIERTDAKLIVINPVNAYIGKVNSHKDSDIRTVLTPLAKLAEDHGVAVVGITHMNKSETLSVIYRAQGSVAYVAAARAVWLVAEDKKDKSLRYFVPIKNNLTINPLGFRWGIKDGEVIIGPEVSGLDVSQLLAPRSADRLEEAKLFLKETLSSAPVQVEQIQKTASVYGITLSTLNRAKRELGVKSIRVKGDPNRWQCALNDTEDGGENSTDGCDDSKNGSPSDST